MALTDTSSAVLQAVHELAPTISARADEIEGARRIPADLNDELRAAGLYRMLVPRSHGGEEIALPEALDIIETLSIADGSVGWTATIGIQSPAVFSLLPRQTFDAVYGDGPDVTVGGAIVPRPAAHVVQGGFRVDGKWAFASGCQNWDYLIATCVLFENGEPKPGPVEGQPETRAMLFPADQAEILDTWYTLGLRGTGSHDISVTDLFVAEDHTLDFFFGTPCVPGIYRYPIVEFFFHIATIAIGIAQGALDEALASAKTRQRFQARATVAKTQVAQHRLGKAETALRAARNLVRGEVERLRAGGSEDDFLSQLVRISAVNAFTGQTCLQVVDTCFRVNGAASVYDGAPLQRRLRDIYTLCQHGSFNDGSLTRAGAALLGEEVGPWF